MGTLSGSFWQGPWCGGEAYVEPLLLQTLLGFHCNPIKMPAFPAQLQAEFLWGNVTLPSLGSSEC